jgi:HPt (histidine-containing phosphotransfer) domain-containing protein
MNEFISKPFDPQALIRKVRHVVERARGAPIALVTCAATPTSDAVDVSRMTSIDAGMVQRTFGEDLSLFKTLLPRILRDFAEFALPVSLTPADESVRRRLRERTHKLKGSAGMIGAIHVMRFAGAAEEALSQARAAPLVEAIFEQLATALATLSDEVDALLASSPSRAARAVTRQLGSPSLVKKDIDELLKLLDDQDMAAEERFVDLSHSLRECLDAARFGSLEDAIDNLEFRRGAELLRSAIRGGDVPGYLPMQKLPKISSSKSSLVNSPVISPNAR